MKSPFAKYQVSGAAPGEELRRLADYVAEKRKAGLYIFSANHLNNPELIEMQHKDHEAELRRQAKLNERVANGR